MEVRPRRTTAMGKSQSGGGGGEGVGGVEGGENSRRRPMMMRRLNRGHKEFASEAQGRSATEGQGVRG